MDDFGPTQNPGSNGEQDVERGNGGPRLYPPLPRKEEVEDELDAALSRCPKPPSGEPRVENEYEELPQPSAPSEPASSSLFQRLYENLLPIVPPLLRPRNAPPPSRPPKPDAVVVDEDEVDKQDVTKHDTDNDTDNDTDKNVDDEQDATKRDADNDNLTAHGRDTDNDNLTADEHDKTPRPDQFDIRTPDLSDSDEDLGSLPERLARLRNRSSTQSINQSRSRLPSPTRVRSNSLAVSGIYGRFGRRVRFVPSPSRTSTPVPPNRSRSPSASQLAAMFGDRPLFDNGLSFGLLSPVREFLAPHVAVFGQRIFGDNTLNNLLNPNPPPQAQLAAPAQTEPVQPAPVHSAPVQPAPAQPQPVQPAAVVPPAAPVQPAAPAQPAEPAQPVITTQPVSSRKLPLKERLAEQRAKIEAEKEKNRQNHPHQTRSKDKSKKE